MKKRSLGILILSFIYIFSFLIGLIVFNLIENQFDIIISLLISDVVATVFVWLCGVIFKSASVYDPYWSVQTVFIYVSLLVKYNNFNLGNIIFFIFILFWAVRLTYNFIHGFHDLSYVDWRYKMLKEKTKGFYQLVNLFGICMFPTLIVFSASIPAFLYVIKDIQSNPFNIIGLLIMFLGTMLELKSDIDMSKFKKTRSSNKEIIRAGLWKWSRHPNYLGEILFWYGVALVYIVNDIKCWYTIIGAILNMIMFLVISIPMAEKNLIKYKEGYELYKSDTRMLLPLRKK